MNGYLSGTGYGFGIENAFTHDTFEIYEIYFSTEYFLHFKFFALFGDSQTYFPLWRR